MLVFCMEFDHERIVYIILNVVGKNAPWAQLMCAESLDNGSLQKYIIFFIPIIYYHELPRQDNNKQII